MFVYLEEKPEATAAGLPRGAVPHRARQQGGRQRRAPPLHRVTIDVHNTILAWDHINKDKLVLMTLNGITCIVLLLVCVKLTRDKKYMRKRYINVLSFKSM